MQRTGVTPAGGVRAPELAALFEAPGPFLSAVLTTEPEIENASLVAQQRWRSLRSALQEQGVPAAALAAVDSHVADAHERGASLFVVTNGRGADRVEHGIDSPARDRGHWWSLPSVVPMIELYQSREPYVVAFVDRRGADLVAAGPTGDRVETLEGRDEPITKVHAGGWSERRYQQRAENTWDHNAAQVAATLERLVREVDAAVVIVAGDTRIVGELQRDLPASVRELVHEIHGGRAAGTDDEREARDIRHLVSTVRADRTVELLRKFREEIGQRDRAADGPTATVAALARAQVDVLLVHDDPDDERTAWYGPRPEMVSTDPEELAALGGGEPQQGRLVDVAVRAAFGTGSAVRVVPRAGPVTGGLGAILRWR